MLVAALALVVAFTGTAIADPGALTSAIKKKTVKRIAKRQIAKAEPGLSVASARTANRADDAQHADEADHAGEADTALEAQTAADANGVKPIAVDYTGTSAQSPAAILIDQGGIRITASCAGPGHARVSFTGTADDGILKEDLVRADGTQASSAIADFDLGDTVTLTTAAAPTDSLTTSITYRGADATGVSGRLLLTESSSVAHCVVSGMLFVG
jgi:hypothetical protein